MNVDIIKILKEISQNEQEKFKLYKEKLVEYCIREKAVLQIFRVLKGIEIELNECLNGRVQVNVERAIIVKVLKTIRTEIDIIKCKMRHPKLIELAAHQPVCEWTDEKVRLVELIYAIQKTGSVNHGNITLRGLQESFEYIFQVKLGNISDKLREINERKGTKIRYLEILNKNLKSILLHLK